MNTLDEDFREVFDRTLALQLKLSEFFEKHGDHDKIMEKMLDIMALLPELLLVDIPKGPEYDFLASNNASDDYKSI